MILAINISITLVIATLLVLISTYVAEMKISLQNPHYFSKTASLSWKTLKELYSVNHSRWEYINVCDTKTSYCTKIILYNTKDSDRLWGPEDVWLSYGYQYAEDIVRVKLSFFGWLMFHFNRIFNKKKNIEGTEMILESVSRDIDKIQRQAQKQIEEANKRITDITLKL